jgi:hypothetical protein
MRSRIDIYRVQLRWKAWNTWEVGLGWVNWLGVSRVVMVIKPPIRFQEYAHYFILNGTSCHVIIISQFGSYHIANMLILIIDHLT